MSKDTSHLDHLNLTLSHERSRLERAKSANEKALRAVWVAQIEKEIAEEMRFLGIEPQVVNMTDEEILNELSK